jgi:hypothetical protein
MSNFINGFGELILDSSTRSWLRSEAIAIPFFNGKKLTLQITEEELPARLILKIESSLKNFFQLDVTYRDSISELIYQNYQKMSDVPEVDALVLEKKSDIWKHVDPREILISKGEDEEIYIQVACECDWEKEHGLQLIFKKGEKITRISGQDGHLTDEHAYGTSRQRRTPSAHKVSSVNNQKKYLLLVLRIALIGCVAIQLFALLYSIHGSLEMFPTEGRQEGVRITTDLVIGILCLVELFGWFVLRTIKRRK